MKKLRLSMVAMFFLLNLTNCAYAQSGGSAPRISVSFNDIVLLDLFSYLRAAYDVDFSYSHRVPLDSKISIRATDLPLMTFLERLCSQLNLTYRIIDNHIVIKKGMTGVKVLPDTVVLPAGSPAIPANHLATGAKEQTIQPLRKLQPLASLLSTVAKGFTLPESRMPEFVSDTPDSLESMRNGKRKAFSIGISAFHDRHNYNFKESPDGQKYQTRKGYGLGVSGILWLNKTLGVSLGLFFTKRGYRVAYHFKAVNPGDPVAFPDKTKACLSYVEIPAGMAFRLFTKNKFTLSVSASLTMSFMTGNNERTAFLNGSKKSTSYFTSDNAGFLWGGAVGVRLWYTLDKSMKIYLEPDYAHYFNLVNKAIMDAGSQVLKTNIGISLNM